MLAPTERPADLVRRRLEQAGYDVADGLPSLGADEIGFLIKFIYKSNFLGDVVSIQSFEMGAIHYAEIHVSYSKKNLRLWIITLSSLTSRVEV